MGALLDLAMSGEPARPAVAGTDSGDLPPLSAVQEAARQDVLARLESHPAVQRAFVTRWENDNLIVTLAIGGIATGELMISADRIGRDDLAAYGAILECLEGVKS